MVCFDGSDRNPAGIWHFERYVVWQAVLKVSAGMERSACHLRPIQALHLACVLSGSPWSRSSRSDLLSSSLINWCNGPNVRV